MHPDVKNELVILSWTVRAMKSQLEFHKETFGETPLWQDMRTTHNAFRESVDRLVELLQPKV